MDPEHDPETRGTIHALVCQPSLDAFQRLCDEQGLTLTALLDALGHRLADLDLADVLTEARAITAARRRRRG